MFTPLNEKEIADIVRLQIGSVQKMLKQNGVQLDVTDAAIDFIGKEGYDPQFGARPVKRVIQRGILNELSKQLIAQAVDKSKPIIVDVKNGALRFEN